MSLQGILTFDRQLAFAASRALNRTVVLGRDAERAALRETFTIRTNWPERGPLRVEAKFGNKNTLSASVVSGATFLPLQEKGGTKKPKGNNLAIPTSKVRRTKRDLILKSLKPANLAKAFVVHTQKGKTFLAVRHKKGKSGTFTGVIFLYLLQRTAHIDAAPTFGPTVKRVVRQEFAKIFQEELAKALSSAK